MARLIAKFCERQNSYVFRAWLNFTPRGLFYIFWDIPTLKFFPFRMLTYCFGIFLEYSIFQKFHDISCDNVFWNINIPNKKLNLQQEIVISLQYSIFQIYQC